MLCFLSLLQPWFKANVCANCFHPTKFKVCEHSRREEPSGARTQLHSSLSISNTSNKPTPEYGLVLKPQRRLQSWLLKIDQIPQPLDLLMKLILCASYLKTNPGISLPLLYRPQLGFSPACNIPSVQTMLLQSSYSQRWPPADVAAHLLWTLIRNSLSPNHLDGFWSSHPQIIIDTKWVQWDQQTKGQDASGLTHLSVWHSPAATTDDIYTLYMGSSHIYIYKQQV